MAKENKIKVCVLTTSYPAFKDDIQSIFVHNLCKELAKKADTIVVCPYYKKSAKKDEVIDGVKVKRFRYFIRSMQTITEVGSLSSFRKSIYGWLQGLFFLKAMFFSGLRNSKGCDLLHCQWSLSALPGYFISKIRKIPYVVTLRGEDIGVGNKGFFWNVQKFVLNHAALVTSNNSKLLDLVKSKGIKIKTAEIRNGVELSLFKKGSKDAARTKLRLPKDKKIILFVGWLIERKGIQHLIDAMPAIVNKVPDAYLAVVGDGELKEVLLEKINSLKLSGHITFIGKKTQQELPAYYNAADILVLPSLSEGMPNVVLEAMASGLPVIATDVDGTPEIIKDGENGMLINPKSAEEISKAVLKLINNAQLKKKFAENSLLQLRKMDMSWKHAAEEYVKAYCSILE